jgi:hypothetical protein
LRLLSASWNLNKVLGFRMTASLGVRLAGTNSDPKPKTKRSVRRPPPGAAADEQLVLYQQGFSHDNTYSARAHEFGNRGQ